MTTRTFLQSSLLVAGLLCATTFQAAAQAGGGGRGGVLTTEQQTAMRDAIQADMTPLTAELTAAQKEAVAAALKGNDGAFETAINKVNAAQAKIAKLCLKAFKAIKLTDEQKTQLEASRDGGYRAIFGGMGGARGARGGGGGGGN
jgi:hypothetical protein